MDYYKLSLVSLSLLLLNARRSVDAVTAVPCPGAAVAAEAALVHSEAVEFALFTVAVGSPVDDDAWVTLLLGSAVEEDLTVILLVGSEGNGNIRLISSSGAPMFLSF